MADPTNSDIADALGELGDLYELDGAIIHRVVAYRTAAQSVRDASTSVAALAREGRATELAGVGKTLQEKILALVEHDEPPGPRAEAGAHAVRGPGHRLARRAARGGGGGAAAQAQGVRPQGRGEHP